MEPFMFEQRSARLQDQLMVAPRSATLEARHMQAFPVLAEDEIARIRPFATLRHYPDGERVYVAGKATPGLLLVLSGAIRITGHDGYGGEVAVVEHGPGAFSGELGQLSGQPSFVDGLAIGAVEVLVVDAVRLQALLVTEAMLGETIMRALILRRVGLIESGAGGPVLIGASSSGDVARLRNFLTRNGIPHLLLDPERDAEAQAVISRYAPAVDEMPLVLCPDGSVLRNPSEAEVAQSLGMLSASEVDRVLDVAIAGAGPAGLAAAVYAASEGLSVLAIDSRSFGGQAGASARIENYLGFPTGISGQALAGRAFVQAQKFGAKMMIPSEIVRLVCDESERRPPFSLALAGGRVVASRTVVIATGARYRRPECANLKAMEGRGVWYWASPIEAKMCGGQEVVVVGGGNSAGQAAVFLAAHAAKVWMLVRGAGLAASMSSYLIDRIAALSNIELCTGTDIAELSGDPGSGLQAVTWVHRQTGEKHTRGIQHVFLFLGAEPNGEWLHDCGVGVDDKGFVQTGSNPASPLSTTVPGVFSIGDVRAGSVKRVGGAIGEGAAVVAQIHAYLASQATKEAALQ
jgi:thioredoxin reductase (NADPH)